MTPLKKELFIREVNICMLLLVCSVNNSHISLNIVWDCPLKPSPSSSSISAKPGYSEQHLHAPEKDKEKTLTPVTPI